MCQRHRRKQQRWGDPLGNRPRDTRCHVDGCENVEQLRVGLCDMHYRRFRRNGHVGPAESLRIIGDDLARFWSHIDQAGPIPAYPAGLGPCWVWNHGYRDQFGYGYMALDRDPIGAHRVAWMLLVGPIPEGLTIDHLCRNTSCVNPEHLEPVTNSENVYRMNLARKGVPWLSQTAPSDSREECASNSMA
jgi:hypothetical protein